MRMSDLLKICLFAVINRYPDSIVEVKRTSLWPPSIWGKRASPEQILRLLQLYAPDRLETPARIVVDAQEYVSVVYLIDDQQGEVPALSLYCGDCYRTRGKRHVLHENGQTPALVIVH